MYVHTALIVASSVLVLVSPLVYARSIIQGITKPHRTTRITIALITVLSTATLLAQHDRVAVWLAAASALQGLGIFILSIKWGMGGWSRVDIACLCIALLGIIAWQSTSDPLLGLYFSIAADFVGMVPALLKTYALPHTENVWFFALDTIAGVLTLAAVSAFTPQQASYPIYIAVINAAMVILILYRGRRLRLVQ
jgi:hypothetical protein